LGSFHSFKFFGVTGQSNWLIAKKKNWSWEAPHLISAKHNSRHDINGVM
jgi:hypothetical protein